MKFLKRLARLIDSVNEFVGNLIAWVTLLMVLVVFVDVVMRYALNISFVFTQELEWHLFSAVFLLGAGYTLLHDGHVRVDIIYQAVSDKARAWINLIGVIFFLIPGCYLIIYTSYNFTYESWSTLEGSGDPGGIPYRFLIKSAIPIGFGLLLIQGFSLGIKSFLILCGQSLEEGEEV
ncbi:MAG: TRAP transporter small permease subunit [Syntrophaceae bacterium]|nr:TRAP transporter small permease subunit [Syntrophaceae bacterium]